MKARSSGKSSFRNRRSKRLFSGLLVALLILLVPFFIPEPRVIPVLEATANDWNPDSFWYEPWGASGTHKGIDIFAAKGQPVMASSHLWVLYTGEFTLGGKVVIGLGPKWRLHYFAHLDSYQVNAGQWLSAGKPLGTVGDSGNAKGKQPHLHFALVSLVPLLWKMDNSTQGYKKAFYLDPGRYFKPR